MVMKRVKGEKEPAMTSKKTTTVIKKRKLGNFLVETTSKVIRLKTGEQVPVVEAPSNLTLYLEQSDIKCAVKHDPTQCAFANAAARMYHAKYVCFHTTVAYVMFEFEDIKSKKIEKAFFRYIMPGNVADQIRKFDKEGKSDPGGYLLLAPSKSTTIEAQIERNKTRVDGRCGAHSIKNDRDKKHKPPIRSGHYVETLLSNITPREFH